MPVTYTWYDTEETIIHWQFIGHWQRDEFLSQWPEATAAGDAKPYAIGVILDFTRNITHPPHALALFRSGEKNLPKNVSVLIIAGNRAVRTLVNIYLRINPNPRFSVWAVATLEEAHSLLESHFRERRNIQRTERDN